MQEEGNGTVFSGRNRGRSDKALMKGKTFSEEANDLWLLLEILRSLCGVRLPMGSIPKEERRNCWIPLATGSVFCLRNIENRFPLLLTLRASAPQHKQCLMCP